MPGRIRRACNPSQNPQELKEKTAQATAELKGNAQAVAAGVREGWSRDKPLNREYRYQGAIGQPAP